MTRCDLIFRLRPLLARLRVAGAIVACGFLTACTQVEPERAGSETADTLSLLALLEWHTEFRQSHSDYYLNDPESRLPLNIHQSLKRVGVLLQSEVTGSRFVQLLPVQLYGEQDASVELLVGDSFFTRKYVFVFQRSNRSWSVVDRFELLGKGPAWDRRFDWEAYSREVGDDELADTVR